MFDIVRFPQRTPWMLSFAAGFLTLAALCLVLVRRYPTRSTPLLIAFVNLVGMALNAYHAIVGAAVAMCLWTLTGLLCSTAVFLRWGRVKARPEGEEAQRAGLWAPPGPLGLDGADFGFAGAAFWCGAETVANE